MLVDTDILIWYIRTNKKAIKLLDSNKGFSISVVSYMELIQGARNQQEIQKLRQAMKYWKAKIIFINETISSNAMLDLEHYTLSHSLELADTLIGATAIYSGLTLHTANNKHYPFLPKSHIKIFRP